MRNHFYRSIFIALFFFSAQQIFCETEGLKKLIPDSISDLQDGSKIEIRTDRKKAKVYINGDFSGLTPLTISNLIEGIYNLKIIFDDGKNEKFEKSYELEVKKNLKQKFYIELFPKNNSAIANSENQQKSRKYKIQHGPLAEK